MWRMRTNNPSLVVGRVDTPAPIVASTGLLIKSIVFADAGGGQLIDATGAVLPIGGASGMVNPPVANNVTDIGTDPLRFRTLFLGTSLVTPTIGTTTLVQHTLPAAFPGEVLTDNALQTVTNKTLFGINNYAYYYTAFNNQPVSMFGFYARGAGGFGPGAAGLAARVPFKAAISSGVDLTAGAIEGGWIDVTASAEQGYAALCGGYAGVAYPIVRATVPAATAGNGLNVQGATMGSNPTLSPFGLGANLGLDFQTVGAGIHRFYGETEFNVTDDGTPNVGISHNMNVAHRLTVSPAAVGMGAAQIFSITDSANVASELGYIVASVQNATPLLVQGSISLIPVDGTGGLPGAGFVVAPTGPAAARVRGVQLIPGATGVNAKFLGIGEAGAGIDIVPDTGGSLRLRNAADTATLFGTEPTSVAGEGITALTSTGVTPAAAVSINAPVGVVDFVNGTAWNTTVTVNNTSVEAGATIFASILDGFDTTFTMVRVSAVIAGQFVLTGNAPCTAPVRVAFLVINPSV